MASIGLLPPETIRCESKRCLDDLFSPVFVEKDGGFRGYSVVGQRGGKYGPGEI